jgi:hypothetical protein
MTNSELNKMSVAELRELRNRVTEMLQLKMQIEGKLNKDFLKTGMTVKYIGGRDKIKNETFVVERINRVNAVCKSNVDGRRWNINIANIQPCDDLIEAMEDDGYEPESGFQK